MMNIRDTHVFAYWQGFWERYRLGDDFGRTHELDQDWNEAYDRGANLADRRLLILGEAICWLILAAIAVTTLSAWFQIGGLIYAT